MSKFKFKSLFTRIWVKRRQPEAPNILNTSTVCIFPVELILNILCNSDPRDIVRWQTVSKWFRAIACDDLLWRALYIRSPFPRPPGPSSSQSRASLERMLVKSVQLAQSWTTRPMREVSSVNIKLGQPLATTPILISGRWLVGCEKARRFVLHDADPRAKTHARKVIWEHKKPIISAWDAHSVSPVPGQSVVYVLLYTQKKQGSPKWKLLEFQLNDESGEIYGSATIKTPPWASNTLSRVELDGGKTRFLLIPTKKPKGMVFDTQTRAFYAVPRWRVALPQTVPHQFFDPIVPGYRMSFTDTHILSLYSHNDLFYEFVTLIQFFTIPSDGSPVQPGIPTLCLTHEGFKDERFMCAEVIKLGVDPITGATSMRLLEGRTSGMDLEIHCVDLLLGQPRGREVLPLSVYDMPVNNIRIPIEGVKTSRYAACTRYLDVGGLTELRGFYRGKPDQKSSELMESQQVIKFSIDTRQDPWAVTWSEIGPAEWRDAADPEVDKTRKGIVFDGLRGRLCYVHPEVKDEMVVVEID